LILQDGLRLKKQKGFSVSCTISNMGLSVGEAGDEWGSYHISSAAVFAILCRIQKNTCPS